ncbi:MAG: TauD/TfdA family dioxygenase [Deltaproteobacteria bacterium]
MAEVPSEIPSGCRVEADGCDGLPLLIEPDGDTSAEFLADWLTHGRTWVRHRLAQNGAFLLRGFAIDSATDFQLVARAVDEELKTEYLGTSPRTPIEGTSHVFSASELPSFYPIPQHAEMTFTTNPPRHLLFCCLTEPNPGGGETPLVDLRAVYRDLDPEVRERFEQGGLKIVRNYASPSASWSFSPWQLKPWPDMFETHDRRAVEAKCREQGFETRWSERGSLCITSTQAVSRLHKRTGQAAWFNHAQVFHLSAGEGEYRRIFAMRPSLRHWVVWKLTALLTALQKRFVKSQDRAMGCYRLDGSEIPDSDMEAVRDAIWRNLVVTPWHKGDVLVIDNHAVGHGRLPYSGQRGIGVCWA